MSSVPAWGAMIRARQRNVKVNGRVLFSHRLPCMIPRFHGLEYNGIK